MRLFLQLQFHSQTNWNARVLQSNPSTPVRYTKPYFSSLQTSPTAYKHPYRCPIPTKNSDEGSSHIWHSASSSHAHARVWVTQPEVGSLPSGVVVVQPSLVSGDTCGWFLLLSDLSWSWTRSGLECVVRQVWQLIERAPCPSGWQFQFSGVVLWWPAVWRGHWTTCWGYYFCKPQTTDVQREVQRAEAWLKPYSKVGGGRTIDIFDRWRHFPLPEALWTDGSNSLRGLVMFKFYILSVFTQRKLPVEGVD